MEKQGSASSDPAAKKTPGVAGYDAREQAQETEETTTPGMAYLAAVYAEALRYIYMTEEELVEEYWQAGKLHRYDRRKEWPKEMEAEIAEYMKYLVEEEEVE